MTDKELRRLSRSELLQMLINQTKENERLNSEIARLKEELSDRSIAVEKAGSLADAVMALNGVFEAAEAASKQYIENIEQMQSRQEEKCREIIKRSEEEAARIRREAEEYAEGLRADNNEAEDKPKEKPSSPGGNAVARSADGGAGQGES